jgi:hypothetical protein
MDWKVNLTFQIDDVGGFLKDFYKGNDLFRYFSLGVSKSLCENKNIQASFLIQYVPGVTQFSIGAEILPKFGVMKFQIPIANVFYCSEAGYSLKIGGLPFYDPHYEYSKITAGYCKIFYPLVYQKTGDFSLYIDIPQWIPKTRIRF